MHKRTHVQSAPGALPTLKDMGGRQLEGTRSGVGWFGSEPKEPLVLERGTAAPPFPPPPLPPHPAPFPLPQLTHAPSPPPPPHPLLPALVLYAAHAGLAPGCPSWPYCEQPEPKKGRGGSSILFRTRQHMDACACICVNVCFRCAALCQALQLRKINRNRVTVKPAILSTRPFTLEQSSIKKLFYVFL